MMCVMLVFKQKTAYELRISDWSSDVCSSDLELALAVERHRYGRGIGHRGVAAAVPHAADADTAPLPRILLVELLRRRAPVAPGRPQRVEAARQARSEERRGGNECVKDG